MDLNLFVGKLHLIVAIPVYTTLYPLDAQASIPRYDIFLEAHLDG